MGLFGKSKEQKAIDSLHSQFGIDFYERDNHNKEYVVSVLKGYSFVAIINRKSDGRFVAKEWYLYDKSNGWVKKASLNRRQSMQLYFETKPYYIKDLLEEQSGKLTIEQEESCCLIICHEYTSNYMTSHYLGFSIKVHDDLFWERGEWYTEAIYMPHQSPPPKEKTASERAEFERVLDEIATCIKSTK